MILPSDQDYQETKRIMLGKSTMNPVFRPLADWIDQWYGVKTINIVYDTIDQGQRPRLQICFETEREKAIFTKSNTFSFDKDTQQAITDKFEQTLQTQGLTGTYSSTNLWIIYSAFEPIAKIDANESIPQDKVIAFKTALHNPDLWEVSRSFSATTFFLYTDEQVKQYENSTLRQEWTDRYFALLKQYDVFNYLKREGFTIYLDSKENFDTHYGSNWWYYYK